MIRPIRFIFLLSLFLGFPAHADYITDKLLVGLYASHDKTGKAIKVLSSGTAVEVLDRKQGYIKVKLKDGTEGWVELRFITKSIPAQARLDKLEEAYKLLQREKEELQKQKEKEDKTGLKGELNKANLRVSELEKALNEHKEKIAAMEEQGVGGSADNSKYLDQIDQLEAKLLQSQIKLAKRMKMDEGTVLAEMDAMRAKMDQAMEILRDKTGEPKEASKEEDDGLPFWVYIMVFLAMIVGVVAGFAVFEYRSRLQEPEEYQGYNIEYRL